MSKDIVRLEIRDNVIKNVVNKIVGRSDVGYEKYGVTLDDDDQSLDARLQHLQEELMDAVNYIEWTRQLLNKMTGGDQGQNEKKKERASTSEEGNV